MTFSRDLQIHPGRDERATGNGWSCAELLFVLTDRDQPGAATFGLRTNWPPYNMERAILPRAGLQPIDVTHHFAVPTMTAQQDKRDYCPYVDGVCHSITDRKSGPMLLALLQTDGSEGVWRMLEQLFTQEARIQRPRITGGNYGQL